MTHLSREKVRLHSNDKISKIIDVTGPSRGKNFRKRDKVDVTSRIMV